MIIKQIFEMKLQKCNNNRGKFSLLSSIMYPSAEKESPMIFHDRNKNNEQTQNCNQNDTVCKLIVDIINITSNVLVCLD